MRSKLRQARSSLMALVTLAGMGLYPMKSITGQQAWQANITSSSTGLTVRVECNNPRAKVKTIAAGLGQIGSARPATLLISGTCHESVSITSLDAITLQGNSTAIIDGGNNPDATTVAVTDSHNIVLAHLTITGGGTGVGLAGQSSCAIEQSTIQNSLDIGAFVGVGSELSLLDTTIRNSTFAGLSVNTALVRMFGGSITANGGNGVSIRNGGTLIASAGDVTPTVQINDNVGIGIAGLGSHATISLSSTEIMNNAGDGISLQGGSTLGVMTSTIRSNGGHQVRIGDLSFAQFNGFQSNTITGVNEPDVVCDPKFSTTRGLSNLTGITTNCPAELPPTP